MEEDLNFVLGNLWSWFLVCNTVPTQLDEIWKTTSIFFKWKNASFFTNRRWFQFCFYTLWYLHSSSNLVNIQQYHLQITKYKIIFLKVKLNMILRMRKWFCSVITFWTIKSKTVFSALSSCLFWSKGALDLVNVELPSIIPFLKNWLLWAILLK